MKLISQLKPIAPQTKLRHPIWRHLRQRVGRTNWNNVFFCIMAVTTAAIAYKAVSVMAHVIQSSLGN